VSTNTMGLRLLRLLFLLASSLTETRIHGMMNKEWEIDPAERATWETDPKFHPLKDPWMATMVVEPPNVNAVCWKDCCERNGIRELECDQVRRRVN